MSSVKDIYGLLDEWAPFSTQLDFDNAGLLIGDPEREIHKVCVCLDITNDIITQAKDAGCELIVSHHPVIFTPLKTLAAHTPPYELAACGIAAICAHTNLDAAVGGVNDALANALGIKQCEPLPDPEAYGKPPLARIGKLRAAAESKELATRIKTLLGCTIVKYVPCKAKIMTVAVCGGSGGDFIVPAVKAGAQALVTGECRHHERLLAKQLGLALFEAGHFCTERFIKSEVARKISAAFPEIAVEMLNETDCADYV